MRKFPSSARWFAACALVAVVATLAIGVAQTPPATSATSATDIASVYNSNCASCHGKDGRGDGPAAGLVNPAPRDFTKGIYKFRSTASGSLPTDDDLVRVISVGLPGTSMPAWKTRLTSAQIGGLASLVKTFSPRFTKEAPALIKMAPPVVASADSINKGRKAYADLACGACHGDGGIVPAAGAPVLKDDWGHDIKAADLTQPWMFRGGAAAADIYTRVKTGINGTPMMAFADTAKDADLWNLANYVASLGRTPTWRMNAEQLKAQYDREGKEAAANPAGRGRYLVGTLNCGHCHSPVDADDRELPGLTLAGGQKFRLAVWGDVVSANLTSDNETGIGRLSDDDLKRAFTRGIKRDETRMLPFPMGWPAFASLSEADQNAIVAYLRTIPPVTNTIPAPVRPNIATYLGTKFQMLILGRDYPLVIFSGNAGSAGDVGGRPPAAGR
jgi:mono/diheme cytochrome c family protein